MSIESEMQTLNANLAELNGLIGSLVGAIAANTSVAASITNTAAPAGSATTTEKPAKPRKAKTEAAAAAPVANALGVSAEQVAEDLKQAPAAAPAEAPQANDDPFGDLNAGETAAPTYTIDDVREVAMKLRDATDMDKAKAFIAKFGVDSIKYLPEEKFADFITKAKAAIAAAAL